VLRAKGIEKFLITLCYLPYALCCKSRAFACGLEEIRTLDLIIANDALYQLSYEPKFLGIHIKKILKCVVN
jgi:hypothetical protein